MVAVPSASGMSTHGNGQGSNHFSQGNGVNQKNVMIQTQYPIMQTSIEASNFSFNPSVDTAMQWTKAASYQNNNTNNNTAPRQNSSTVSSNVHGNTIVRSDSPDVPSMDRSINSPTSDAITLTLRNNNNQHHKPLNFILFSLRVFFLSFLSFWGNFL